MKPHRATASTHHLLVQLALAFLIAAWSSASSADFPPSTKFITGALNPPVCVSGGELHNGVCDQFPTREEACAALMVAYNNSWPSCGPGVLAACLDTPENNVLATFFKEQTFPFTCHAGTFTIGATTALAPAVCPDHSAPVGSSCGCSAGFFESGASCVTKNNGCITGVGVGNPCTPSNGNKYEQQPLYRGLNGFELSLVYNSYDTRFPARIGRRWRDSFDRRVTVDGANVTTFRQDGKAFRFVSSGGAWVGEADGSDRLIELKDAQGARTGWELRVGAGDETETYDASGKLVSIRSRSGLAQTLTYSDGTGGAGGGFLLDASGQPTAAPIPAGQLIRVSDNFGRTLAFSYDSTVQIARVVDPSGGIYAFSYLVTRNLASIAFPDSRVRSFLYNEPANTGGANLPYALTGITDENGNRFATFQFDAQERAVSTEHAGGAQRYTLSYGANNTTTVTDPHGTARTYGFDIVLNAFKNTGISGPACPSCGPAAQSFDANGNVASRTDWNGNVTVYGYDLSRNLETSRTEAFGTAQARTISTAWDAIFRLPTAIAEPLRITTSVYDSTGAQCGAPGALCSKTIQPTSDATGAAGFGATAAGSPRTWSYTYNGNGSVLTMNGPRTDVADLTSYTYYPNDDADPGKRGNLASITNALGQVTQILAYNAHGQPLAMVDPNGLTTTLGYDLRQRLTSRNSGGEITSYEYDNAGQLIKVTLPDGSFLAYGYDAAHRLTGIADNLGNNIVYTLDAMGNRTREDVHDTSGSLAQTRSRVYDALNRLSQEIGAQSQTTQYDYDNQGNVTGVTDPLSHATVNQYDALNRLKQVTDPNMGETRYAYNGLDQLVAVTDPRNLTTSYNYDGLANLNAQTSPDTGTTANLYDDAGNLLSQIDAKGQTTSYTYDALNRVTAITFADGSKQTYGYDQGVNGVGRLSFISETDDLDQVTSLIDYAYDAHGRPTAENRTVEGVSYTLAYGYDAAGRLNAMTYPSGRTVAYAFDALGRVNQVSTTPPPATGGATQIVASNITYQPFGGVKSYLLGNGQSYSRDYDLDGRIADYGFGTQGFALGYDPAGRIVTLANVTNATNANAYGYDALDRLTSATTPATPFAYSYDTVGNRTSKTVGTSTDTYTYSTTSNQIASIAGSTNRSFSFDPNGSTTSDGPNQYGYDARGRMVSASSSASGTTFYQVNALGQRIRKANATEEKVFLYDTSGRLIGEASPSGAPIREYLWLNDLPLAVAATPQSSAQCPATPTRDRSGSFTPFDSRERIEAKAGQPGPAGWEWAAGPAVGTAGAFSKDDIDWVSGKVYDYRIEYDPAAGVTRLVVRDGATVVARTRWNGLPVMRTGNAVRLVIRIDDQGVDSRMVLTIDTVDGVAIGERVVVRGNATLDPDAGRRIYAGLSLADGFVIEGTLKLVYPTETTPTQREFNLKVTAGNVTCATGPTTTTSTLHYVLPDHLNTPRLISDGTGTTVWRWDQGEPFGNDAPNDNPSGAGAFDFPLRFPGQYADRETGIFYNYYRDLDPSIGRYLQSDPIGLAAGLNTYTYVKASPIRYADPFGLMADCGPEGGWQSYVIPNNPLGFPFQPCCDSHDKCYDNCKGPDKLGCDMDFCGCVFDKCKAYTGYVQTACRRNAQEYCYRVLDSDKAADQFKKARDKCKCKP